MSATKREKRYLGDAVYVEIDEDAQTIILTTEDGVSTTNRVVLDVPVLEALDRYLDEKLGPNKEPA